MHSSRKPVPLLRVKGHCETYQSTEARATDGSQNDGDCTARNGSLKEGAVRCCQSLKGGQNTLTFPTSTYY